MSLPIAVVLAVDPGMATGIVVAHIYPRGPHDEPPTETAVAHPAFHRYFLDVGEPMTVTYDDMPEALSKILGKIRTLHGNYVPLHVVLEKFVITRVAMQENATWSSEVTGMTICATKLLFPSAKIDTTQKPADMKPLVPRTVLRSLGLWATGMTDHEADAIGHAILYAARASTRQVKL